MHLLLPSLLHRKGTKAYSTPPSKKAKNSHATSGTAAEDAEDTKVATKAYTRMKLTQNVDIPIEHQLHHNLIHTLTRRERGAGDAGRVCVCVSSCINNCNGALPEGPLPFQSFLERFGTRPRRICAGGPAAARFSEKEWLSRQRISFLISGLNCVTGDLPSSDESKTACDL